ncbi:MAG: hypothetical protein ACRCZF_27615, partial [Gemmataceae bacterium]
TTEFSANPEKAPVLPKDTLGNYPIDAKLKPEEIQNLNASTYSPLDGSYLFECLYLRDAARSLDVQEAPPGEQATAALAWVSRQVYLRPTPQQPTPPGLPTIVLRRGFGIGIERAYILLGLLQQMGLEACLVGPGGISGTAPILVRDNAIARGPFWAVAVRAGNELILLNPWFDTIAPTAVSWTAAKANPELLKSWGVAPVEVQSAAFYLSIPFTAAAPRMKPLEEQLQTSIGVKLFVAPTLLMTNFAKFGPVNAWSSLDDYVYGRLVATFTPKAEGGTDPSGATQLRRTDALMVESVLRLIPEPPEELRTQEARLRMLSIYESELAGLFAGSQPRERMHRGQFNDVTRLLVAKDTGYANALERMRSDGAHKQIVKSWLERANTVYEQLRTAKLPANRDNLPAAENAVQQFWQTDFGSAQAVLDQTLAGVGRGEVTYLLALCKHEQAERAQFRFQRAPTDASRQQAVESWNAARDTWGRFLNYSETTTGRHPGRRDHAKLLSDRATKKAADPKAAD